MNFLYAKENLPGQDLTSQEKMAVFYHDIFDFPLTYSEIIKWSVREDAVEIKDVLRVVSYGGYYFLEGRKGNIFKRELRRRISRRKLEIAKKAAKILSFIPTIQTIAITGALAMENTKEESDIDFLLITKKGNLWISRLLSYLVLGLFKISVRKPGKKDEEDRLCLNIWLDESDLTWPQKDRNIYTAHEIAQIKPLINKVRTHEKFLGKNDWIRDYWPNAVKITKEPRNKRTKEQKRVLSPSFFNFFSLVIENLAFRAQYAYMKKKITREIVTPTRAIFHPIDLGKVVLSRF